MAGIAAWGWAVYLYRSAEVGGGHVGRPWGWGYGVKHGMRVRVKREKLWKVSGNGMGVWIGARGWTACCDAEVAATRAR